MPGPRNLLQVWARVQLVKLRTRGSINKRFSDMLALRDDLEFRTTERALRYICRQWRKVEDRYEKQVTHKAYLRERAVFRLTRGQQKHLNRMRG